MAKAPSSRKTTRKGRKAAQPAAKILPRNPKADIFLLLGYEVLRGDKPAEQGGRFDALHTVFCGFNRAFRHHFGDTIDCVAYMQSLEAQDLISIRPARGGVLIKPKPGLLWELSDEERSYAREIRALLETVKAEVAAACSRKKAPPAKAASPAVKSATRLFEKGDTAAAMKKLGLTE